MEKLVLRRGYGEPDHLGMKALVVDKQGFWHIGVWATWYGASRCMWFEKNIPIRNPVAWFHLPKVERRDNESN